MESGVRARLGALALMCVTLSGCLLPPAAPPTPASAPAPRELSVTLARHQTNFISLAPLGLPAGAGTIEVSPLDAGQALLPAAFTADEIVWRTGQASSPAAEQLRGEPVVPIDLGSYLLPLTAHDQPQFRGFQTGNVARVMLRMDVAPTVPAGDYTLRLHVTPAAEVKKGQTAAPATDALLHVHVSDILLPNEPSLLAVATTTTQALAALYPKEFGPLPGQYLDRDDKDQAAAVDRLDTLVKAAHRQGVALFVEDLAPTMRLDSVGRVLLDWDAYDRTMFGYMDGSAFGDRLPAAAWLAPLPPKRIQTSAAQLRQYYELCIEHHDQKQWPGVAVLTHPALLDPDADGPFAQQVLDVIHDAAPDATVLCGAWLSPHQPRLWVTADTDRRLPPVGELADAETVRVWPWMCAARDVKGLAWRDAVTARDATGGSYGLLAAGEEPAVTLRLAWLHAGLNDAEHFALLKKRSDPVVAKEILAGVVGRTGLASAPPLAPEQVWRAPAAGYLYAGWPTNPDTWQTLPSIVDTLIAAATPGEKVTLDPNDPLYIKARLFLVQAHRPTARVRGFTFGLEPGREGRLVKDHTGLLIENPVAQATQMSVRWPNLPGDLGLDGSTGLQAAPYAVAGLNVAATGHLESLRHMPDLGTLQLTESATGAALSFPVDVPIFRTAPTEQAIRIDGKVSDWPERARIDGFERMPVRLRYLARPDLLEGRVRQADDGAWARITYDTGYVYVYIDCPQPKTDEQRNNQWPMAGARWWGTDGVQVQIAGGPALSPGTRVMDIAVKPSGTAMVKAATLVAGARLIWTDGPTGLQYAVDTNDRGYGVEMAIPRTWFATEFGQDKTLPLWRVNILRHVGATNLGMTWAGPVINDDDIGMMGVVIGGRTDPGE